MMKKDFLERARRNTKEFLDIIMLCCVAAFFALFFENITMIRRFTGGILVVEIIIVFYISSVYSTIRRDEKEVNKIRKVVEEILEEREKL